MTNNLPWVAQALTFAVERIRQNMTQLTGFPHHAQDGVWTCAEDGGWVGGHWVGLLWLAFAYTHDPTLETQARKWAARLTPRQHDTGTHDLGFLFELSHLLGLNLTGDTTLKSPALQAARSLTQRFNPRGRFFQAWGPLDAPAELRGRTIVDTMMNLDLLFWASRETSEPHFASQATAHACTCLEYHVRSDYSTSHGVDFDPETGLFLKQETHQGFSPTSCWSRGQSWAVYGFTDCFRATHDPTFLTAARGLADYALNHLPEDYIPFWDYTSPIIPHDVRDSAAASILGSGLLYLATLETDPNLAQRWQNAAEQILASLWQHYSSRKGAEASILLHGTFSKPQGLMDHGLIYGDYYFVEGLLRLIDPDLAKILH